MKHINKILNTPGRLLPKIPNAPGVYVLTDSSNRILYIGRSKQLSRRVSHLTALQNDKTNSAGLSHIKAGCVRKHQDKHRDVFGRWEETETEEEAKSLEKKLLAENQTAWNGHQCKARIKPCTDRTCSTQR
jgi:DNA polymerase-3 subunit epsilon